jgi:hypothetical protein
MKSMLRMLLCSVLVFLPLQTVAQSTQNPVPVASYYGAYSPVWTYAKGSLVTYGGSMYIALLSSNFNNTPGTTGSIWWAQFSSAGGGPSTPALGYDTRVFAVSQNASAFLSGGFSTYNANQPSIGSVNPSVTGEGYMYFGPTPSVPTYVEYSTFLPPYWNSVGGYISFYSTAASGNAVINVQTACTAANNVDGTLNWGTPVSVTVAVSSTGSGIVTSPLIANIAANSVNGCSAAGTTTPTEMFVRIYADATSAVPIYAKKWVQVTGRTQ